MITNRWIVSLLAIVLIASMAISLPAAATGNPPVYSDEPKISDTIVHQPLVLDTLCVEYEGLDRYYFTSVPYRDDTFIQDALTLNISQRHLEFARTSAAMAAAAYQPGFVSAALVAMGFQDVWTPDHRDATEEVNDFTGVAFARKTVQFSGGKQEIFAIFMRGTVGYEWVSDFNFNSEEVENKSRHAGFEIARSKVMANFKRYYDACESMGIIDSDLSNNSLWITGHSRGAAVANLLAADLSISGAFAPANRIFAYLIACPNVELMKADVSAAFTNIVSFNNSCDLITRLAPSAWGFRRYGITVDMDRQAGAKKVMEEIFGSLTDMLYKGQDDEGIQDLMVNLGVLIPNRADYERDLPTSSGVGRWFGTTVKPSELFTAFALVMGKNEFNLAADLFGGSKSILLDYAKDFSVGVMVANLVLDGKITEKVAHAHSLESYMSWMTAISKDPKKVSNFGLPAYLSHLKVTGGMLSPAFGPCIMEYTVSVTSDNGKVTVSAEPASWYDSEARESRKGKVVLEFRSDELGVRTREKTKIDLVIPVDGADLSLNVLTWETGEQTKYTLHFVREKATETGESGESTVTPGDYVTFGRYEQDNDLQNGQEPIQWRVLTVENGNALLISEKNLDAKQYNEAPSYLGDITWEESTLRDWLNKDFLNSAFTTNEQNSILTTVLRNDDNPQYGTDGGGDTRDNVFLLSIGEAEELFKSDEDRRAPASAYAREQGAYDEDGGSCPYWWLRSPGGDSIQKGYAACVSPEGIVDVHGFTGPNYFVAVRPAIWVDLDSANKHQAINETNTPLLETNDSTLSIGDTLIFGNYEQDNNLSNGKEPIKWRVLAIEDGQALLISEMNLNRKFFDGNYSGVTWENSSLRWWLNKEFLTEAFWSEEQQKVMLTRIRNDDSLYFGTEGGDDTLDRVFVLSIEEALEYFSTDDDRKSRNTEYAKAQDQADFADLWVFSGEFDGWWLRSSGAETGLTAVVRRDGSINREGIESLNGGCPVRPAIWHETHNSMLLMNDSTIPKSYGDGLDNALSQRHSLEVFKQAAFKSEYETEEEPLRRWTEPIRVWVGGDMIDEDEKTLDNLIAQLNERVENLPPINRTYRKEEANITVVFGPLAELHEYTSGYVEGNWSFENYYWNNEQEMIESRIAIAFAVTNQRDRNHLLMEMLVRALGLTNNIDTDSDSILYQDWTTTQALSDLDWELLNLLYNPRLSPGIDPDEAIKALGR